MTSSLDIRDPEGLNLFLNTSNSQQTISGGLTQLRSYHVSTDNSVVPYPLPQFGFGVAEHNQAHAFPNTQNAGWLISSISGANLLANFSVLSNRTYNFGDSKLNFISTSPSAILKTKNTIRNNLTINQTGQLWINRNDKITFTDDPLAPLNALNQTQTVSITKGGSCNDLPTKLYVHNGGSLKIGENTSNNVANLNITDGTILEIGIGGTCFLDKKGIITVKNGGQLIISGSLTTEADAKIIIEDGGAFYIKKDGLVNISWGSQIILNGQSYMEISTGGTLRVSHYSKLFALKDSHISFGAGCNIQLWDGSLPNGEARIQLAGKWTYNGKFNFSGNGYFEIEETHNFDIKNPNIEFEGSGKDFMFMRFSGITKFKIPKFYSFSLKNARMHIATYGYYGIKFEERNDVQFINATLSGTCVSSCTRPAGIICSYGTSFSAINTDFVQLDDAVSFEYDGNNKTKPFLFKDCNFKACETGILASFITTLNIENCNFNGDYSNQAINLEGVNDVKIFNSVVKDYKGTAIMLTKTVQRLRILKSLIEKNGIGIEADEDAKPNIFLSQRTTIQNCKIGILIAKGGTNTNGTDWGLVDMDCANLLYNDVGVQGEDLLLSIDAYSHISPHCNKLRPNRFECNLSQLLFDICYVNRNINTVFAKGNYFNDLNLPTPSYHLNLGACNQGHFSNVDLNISGFVTKTPTTCPCGFPFGVRVEDGIEFTANPEILLDDECEIQYLDENEREIRVNLKNQFQEAYYCLSNGDEATAMRLFAAISSVDTILFRRGEICNFYIHFAKNIADPYWNYRSSIGTWSSNALLPIISKIYIDNIIPYPNPTSESFNIAMKDKGIYELRLTNQLGIEVMRINFIDNINYNMEKLPSGIYIIEIFNLKN